MKFSSIDEAKDHFFRQEVDMIMRESFVDQIEWIEKKVKIDPISNGFSGWSDLIELFERRNLFAHTKGRVSDQYLKSAKLYKFKNIENIEIGKELHAGPKYFLNAVRIVSEFYVKLFQVIWRKNSEIDVGSADGLLNDFGLELIVRGEYDLAIKILEFGIQLRGISNMMMTRMMLVNLANAHRLNGNVDRALALLDVDWSMADNKFKICVAAVRGDDVEVVRIMNVIGKSGDVDRHQYQDWPVFFHVRDSGRFLDAYKELFGVDFVHVPKERATFRQVLDALNEERKPMPFVPKVVH